MRWLLLSIPLLLVGFLTPPWFGRADDASKPPVGIDKRVPWTTSKVKGSPEPPPPYRTEIAFPKLKFDEPLELSIVPGSEPAGRRRAPRQDLHVRQRPEDVAQGRPAARPRRRRSTAMRLPSEVRRRTATST